MASIIKIGDKWRASVRLKGHKPRHKTFAVKARAEEWARQIEADIDRGIVLADPGRVTMAQVIKAYRELRESSARPISDSSNEHYMLKRLNEGIGQHLAGSLSPQHLVDHCKMRKEEGAGPYTCNMEISKLGTVMRYASVSMRLNLQDVVGQSRPLLNHLGLIGGGGRRERRPTEDELERIIADMEQPYADAVEFAAITAMRRGEICAIKWEDLDPKKKMVHVWRKHPRKGKVLEWVPLLGKSWDIVQRQQRTSDRIFPMHIQTISKYFHEACVRQDIIDLRFHDLRHEGTSALFEQGYSIEQVALVTGHKSWSNLRIYSNLKPEMLHEHKHKNTIGDTQGDRNGKSKTKN